MRKIILFALFVLSLQSYVSAQIQNKVLGLTVGASTKQEVKSRFYYEGEFTEKDDVLVFTPKKQIYFGSYYWDKIYFAFFNNTLLTISLEKNDSSSYKYLSAALSKYREYRKKSNSDELDIFEDGKTKIMCYTYTSNYRKYLRLSYIDIHLFNQKENYGMEDL